MFAAGLGWEWAHREVQVECRQTVRLSLGHVPLLESVAGCFLVSGLSGLLSLDQNGVLVKLYWVLSQEANKGLPWRSGETVDPRVTEVILGDLGLQ